MGVKHDILEPTFKRKIKQVNPGILFFCIADTTPELKRSDEMVAGYGSVSFPSDYSQLSWPGEALAKTAACLSNNFDL